MGFPKKRVLYILFGEGILRMKEKGGSSTTEEIKIIDEKIKAEILRGDAAVYDVTLQAGVDFQKASEGILAVINENKKNTDTEAFHLGAYFKAWNSFASMIKVLKQWADPAYSKTIGFGERNAQNYFKEFRKRQKEMKMDEQTLMAITEVRFAKVRPEMDEGETKIKNEEEKKTRSCVSEVGAIIHSCSEGSGARSRLGGIGILSPAAGWRLEFFPPRQDSRVTKRPWAIRNKYTLSQ